MSDSDEGESFFGLIVKPNKRYDTKVQKGFRLTKACIEPSTLGGDKITSLYLEYDSDEFIISNLYKGQLSENLDILFNVGEQISFKVDGPGTIHLTGNTIDQEDPPFPGMGDFDDEDDEDSEDVDMESPDTKSVKRKIKELQKGNKKIKMDSSNGKADDEDSSSEDDSDDDDTGAETTTLSDLDSTTNFAEEEDSDESDDDEGEEEEDDSEGEDSDEENDSDDSEEVKESPKKKAKVNGDVSPSKKAKLEAKSPKQKGAETPKADKNKKEAGTPKPNKTPKAEVKTPKQEAKSPKSEKTPKQEVKTPKSEKTPKGEKTPKQDAPKTPKGDAPKTPKEAKTPKSVKKISGMLVEDVKEGTGAEVKNGRPIGMYYAGRLQTNNKQFDSCTQGKPFKFRLGAGEVIKGWDVGIAGMKVGGKRKLTIPPHMAYGKSGAPPDIPPNSTLVFDIECKFAS